MIRHAFGASKGQGVQFFLSKLYVEYVMFLHIIFCQSEHFEAMGYEFRRLEVFHSYYNCNSELYPTLLIHYEYIKRNIEGQ